MKLIRFSLIHNFFFIGDEVIMNIRELVFKLHARDGFKGHKEHSFKLSFPTKSAKQERFLLRTTEE